MKITVILLSTICFLLCACSTVNTVERASSKADTKYVDDKRVITNSSLDDYAYVASVNEARLGGLLKIQARIVNSSSSARTIRYQFVWIDKNGMEASSSPWMRLMLDGGEASNISAVAPHKNVCDFSLKLLPND